MNDDKNKVFYVFCRQLMVTMANRENSDIEINGEFELILL
jgi:hypothetical protein